MEEYYIYKVNGTFKTFSEQYPKAIHHMARCQKDEYENNQYHLLFLDHHELDKVLYHLLESRNDYTYKKHVHYIRNRFTGAFCLVLIYSHCIYLKCTPKFDIMKNIILQSDINYVILDK